MKYSEAERADLVNVVESGVIEIVANAGSE